MQRLTRFAEYLAEVDPSMLLEMPWTPDKVRVRLPVATMNYDPEEEGSEPRFGEGWEAEYYQHLVDSAKKADDFVAWWKSIPLAGEGQVLKPAAKGLVKYLYGYRMEKALKGQDVKDIYPYVHSQGGYSNIIRYLYGQHLSDYADQPDDAPDARGADEVTTMREYIFDSLSGTPAKGNRQMMDALANRVINKWLTGTESNDPPQLPGVYPFVLSIPGRGGGGNRNGLKIVATRSPLSLIRGHLRRHGLPQGAEKGFDVSAGSRAELDRGKEMEARFSANTARYATVGLPAKSRDQGSGAIIMNPGMTGNPAMNYFREHLWEIGRQLGGGEEGSGNISDEEIVDLLRSYLRVGVDLPQGGRRPLVSDEVWDIFTGNPSTHIAVVQRGVRGSIGTSKCIPEMDPRDDQPRDMFVFRQFVGQIMGQCLVHASQPRQHANLDPLDRVRSPGLLNECAQDFSFWTAKKWFNVDCRHAQFSKSLQGMGSAEGGDFQPQARGASAADIAADNEEDANVDAAADVAGIGDRRLYKTYLQAVKKAGMLAIRSAPGFEDYDELEAEAERVGFKHLIPRLQTKLSGLRDQMMERGKRFLVGNPVARRTFRDFLEADPDVGELMANYDSEYEDDDEEAAAPAPRQPAASAVAATVAAPPPARKKAPPKKKRIKEWLEPLPSWEEYLYRRGA